MNYAGARLHAREAYSAQTIVERVIEVHNVRKKRTAQKVNDFSGSSVSGLKIGVLGVTFKTNTDDMRDAPSLDIVPALLIVGAKVVALDSDGMKEAAYPLRGITFTETAR